MTRTDTQCDIQEMSYTIQDSGKYAGYPAVVLSFGEERGDNYTVNSIKGQADAFGWTSKLHSHRVPLVFNALEREGGGTPYDPCFPRYAHAIADLTGVMRPGVVVVESRGMESPVERVQDAADYFSVRLSQRQIETHYDGGREVWDWFASRARYEDDVEFILDVENMKAEEYLKRLQKSYKIPQSSIILNPVGDTIQEVNDGFETVKAIAKRNEWKINPRVEFLESSGLENDE